MISLSVKRLTRCRQLFIVDRLREHRPRRCHFRAIVRMAIFQPLSGLQMLS